MPTIADNIIASSSTNFFKLGSIFVATIFVVVLHQSLPTTLQLYCYFVHLGLIDGDPEMRKMLTQYFLYLQQRFSSRG